jgi:hypothetical protein
MALPRWVPLGRVSRAPNARFPSQRNRRSVRHSPRCTVALEEVRDTGKPSWALHHRLDSEGRRPKEKARLAAGFVCCACDQKNL